MQWSFSQGPFLIVPGQSLRLSCLAMEAALLNSPVRPVSGSNHVDALFLTVLYIFTFLCLLQL